MSGHASSPCKGEMSTEPQKTAHAWARHLPVSKNQKKQHCLLRNNQLKTISSLAIVSLTMYPQEPSLYCSYRKEKRLHSATVPL